MKPKKIAILVLAVLLAVVIFQNSRVAVVQLLFWKITMSMIVLIFMVALIGFVIGWLTRHHVAESKRDR
jgi:uncharacterized integral membrane protein